MKFFLILWSFTILNIACNASDPIRQDNTIEATIISSVKNNLDSANYYVIQAKIKGKYQSISWNICNEPFEKDTIISYYFPQKGEYSIILQIHTLQGELLVKTHKIIIKENDPAFVPNKLIWSDEFNDTTLNLKDWSVQTNIDVNNELQRYTPYGNWEVKDGMLIITARKSGSGQHKYDYTSARIFSKGKKEIRYGRIEMRAKLPMGRGTWPAGWMLGANHDAVGWPACGELDIMEHVGFDPQVMIGSIHTPSSHGNTKNTSKIKVSDCEQAFHVYGIIWTPLKIEFYVDDPNHPYYTYAPSEKNLYTWPFDQPCYFIFNLAVGGNWGGQKGVDDSIFPVSMLVDYIRVYSYR